MAEQTGIGITISIGQERFAVSLEDNQAVKELAEMLSKAPLTIEMEDYGGFEKVGNIGKQLPSNDQKMTTQNGDIVLYHGHQLVVFYGSNTWSYTKIGKVKDKETWKCALGTGSISITVSLSA